MTKGHWFCDGRCNDVVHLRGQGRPDDVERCPVCGEMSATFVPDVPCGRRRISDDAAKFHFAEMRRAVNESTNE